MPTMTKTSARKLLVEAIAKELDIVLHHEGTRSPPSKASKEQMGVSFVSGRIADLIVKDDMLAQCVSILHPNIERWLKTEEVAEKIGFSRPYTAALLDSDEFEGLVQKTEGGHRRVKSSAVDAWMESRGVKPVSRPAENILRNSPAEFFDEPTLSAEEEAAVLAKVKNWNEQSRKHRPASRRK